MNLAEGKYLPEDQPMNFHEQILSMNAKNSTVQKVKEIKKKRKAHINKGKVHQGEALCHARSKNVRTSLHLSTI